MRAQSGILATVIPWVAGIAVLTGLLWISGVFSVAGKPMGRTTTSAEVIAVQGRTWTIRLMDGRSARVLVDAGVSRKPGDRVMVQLVRYDTGRVEATYLGH